MNTISIFSTFKGADFILLIVIIQILITTTAGALIALGIFKRQLRKKQLAKIKAQYLPYITFLLADEDVDFSINSLPTPPIFQRSILKGAIINLARELTNNDKTKLAAIYAKLGFVDRDFRDLKSLFWWRQLRALAALDLLNIAVPNRLLEDLHKGENPQVSISALRSRIKLGYSNLNGLASEELLAKFESDWDCLYDILRFMAEYQPSELVEFYQDNFASKIGKICLDVFLELRVDSAVEAARKNLSMFQDQMNTDQICAYLTFLGSMSDFKSLQLAEKLVNHESIVVKEIAINTVVALRPA